MSDYAILSWLDGACAAAKPLDRVTRALRRLGWSQKAHAPGLQVWAPIGDPSPIFLSPDRDGLVIGRVAGAPQSAWRSEAAACAQALCATIWGRYVAAFRAPDGHIHSVLRDPSGGLEALAWRHESLAIVASDVDILLEAAPPDDLSIDWDRLGAALVDRAALASDCPLRGVAAVTPGALRRLGGGETQVWRPTDFAAQHLDDTAQTRRDLVEAVDKAVSLLVAPDKPAIAELSGGLDSSIVGAALVRQPTVEVAQWLHYFVEDAASDERSYARAAARCLQVALTEVPKDTLGLNLDALALGAQAIRPSGAIADAHYDQDIAARCRRLGAGQIVTGLGGDTVFMQGGGALLAADDYWRGPALRLRPALQVARAVKTSVWTVWRRAQAARLGWTSPSSGGETAHLTERARKASFDEHPWFSDLDRVRPAKRRQIRHLAQQLQVFGRTARGQVADIVHPLLSQPVMEVCLRLSVRALTHGGDDRAMARLAFQERLAPEIFARRSKGDLGRHYGRAINQDLEAIRDLLLDGQLVAAGLLDPEGLDGLLTAETLIWKGPYREIVNMLILEQWARSWTRRLGQVGRWRAERPVKPV